VSRQASLPWHVSTCGGSGGTFERGVAYAPILPVLHAGGEAVSVGKSLQTHIAFLEHELRIPRVSY